MSKRLYVGNLPYTVTQDEVHEEFAKFGPVSDCKLITDRETGRAKGFGFVTFTNDADADRAINALNGQNFSGRSLTVNEATERPRTGGGGGGGFNRSGPPPQGRPADPPRDNGGGGGRKGGGGGGGSRRQRGGDRDDSY